METPPNLPILSLVERVAVIWPPEKWRDCHLLVALSGGADSVALLRVLIELQKPAAGQGRVLAAHFNHNLRPDDADADEAWVQELCEQLGVPLHIGRADRDENLASEQQAREARYAFLAQTAEATGVRFVATGHTADDQIETVLMRVLRGSGIAGLSGIPFVRPLAPTVTVVRPLLEIRRQEIEAYLAKISQTYRTDVTNAQTLFTRNWVRGELLPTIRDRLEGDVDQALLRLAGQAGEWREAILPMVEQLTSGAIEPTPARIVFHAEPLANLPAIVLQEACRSAWQKAGWSEQSMGMEDWQRLAAAIAGEGFPPFMLPGNVRVRHDGAKVVLARG